MAGGRRHFVCGDAKAMAKDVRAALVRAYSDVKGLSPEAAEQAVVTLERESAICRIPIDPAPIDGQ
jgi:sulfite reductase (NADPH) flavoprotein alpha-component